MTGERIRALLVEDNPGDARLLQVMLRRSRGRSIELVWSDHLAAGLARLQNEPFDVILLDLSLPESQGLETFHQVYAQAPGLPIIMLTGLDDEAIADQAVRQGAQDYLVKGRVDGELLTRAIRYAIERKRSQQAVRESEERYRRLFNTGNDAIFVYHLDAEGKATPFVEVNEVACSRLGYSREELLQRTFSDISDVGQDSGVVQARIRDLLDGEPVIFDAIQIAQDGTRIPVEISSQLFDLRGRPAVMSIARDVTERKLAEKALRRYADDQAALYAVASAMATSLDLDELLSTILDVALPVLGADAGWVTRPTSPADGRLELAVWRGAKPPFQTDQTGMGVHQCPVFQIVTTGAGTGVEQQVVDSCPYLPASVMDRLALGGHVCIPLISSGQQLGVLTVGWREPQPDLWPDRALMVTIGRQVGLALYNAQLYQDARQVDRLRVLNDLDHNLAATLDPARVAEVTLRHIAAALDASQGMLMPRNLQLSSQPDRVLCLEHGWLEARAAEQCPVWQYVSPTGIEGDEIAENPKDAVDKATVLTVPIHSDGRRIADLVLSGRPPERPFTDQDWALALAAAGRAGQAIRNAQLYDEVRALLREREETQAQLIHTEKMSALGRLTASIAHEINNPIQSVLSCLNLATEELEEEGRRDKLDRYLSIAEGEIERIAAIVRRMRDFYRPATRGRQQTDPHEILEGVLALTTKQLQYADVEIRRAWCDDLPIVEADPDHLKQVFLNLTLNAADAMPHGGLLEVRTARDQLPGQGDAARIEFRDSGVGIPPDVQARLFEPFFTTKEDGSGLGLYITYGIVESHHGQIRVESHPGLGTTFTILLPVQQPPEAQPAKGGAGMPLRGGGDRAERT